MSRIVFGLTLNMLETRTLSPVHDFRDSPGIYLLMVKSFNWYIRAAVRWFRTTRGILGKVWEVMEILEILLLIDPFFTIINIRYILINFGKMES